MSASAAAAAPPPPKAVRESTAAERLHTRLVLGAKFRMADNALRNIRRHMYIHLGVGLATLFGMLGLGSMLFYGLFRYLMRQDVFGPILMDRLVDLVILIFFSLLVFSNLIITLSTTYLSKEVEFLMGQPVSRQAIFRMKLLETVLYSSWAFALLSLPLFASYGVSRHAVWYFYPLVVVAVAPFLMIPASLGAIVTMFLAAFFPARKTRTLCIVLGLVSMGASVLVGRMLGIGRLLRSADEQQFDQILTVLSVGNMPLLPSAWLGNALRAIGPADSADVDLAQYAYWTAMLLATGLFLLETTRWLVPRLYYRGWTLAKDTAMAPRSEADLSRAPAFSRIDSLLERFPGPVAGLLSKDLKTFWRDPSQWTQIVILVGLMTVYMMNLRGAARSQAAVEFIVNEWKSILVLFNLAASCFILSILTTRFVYPMLSLEGRGFWTVGLAPIPRTRIVWQKYVLCLAGCLVVSHTLTAISNAVLEVDPAYMLLTHGMVTVLSVGLTSLSVGLGAIVPNFTEDNPARIANGLGGTLNVILSLLYIGVGVWLLAVPIHFVPRSEWAGALWERFGALYVAVVALMHAAVILVPLRLGLRRWAAHEF
ncbi:MAG: hypothetical protein SF028_02360 [Candidatus Sumerlaeia bacterium]|nr:hypothetical protein [Candidatus Sumerlaeia bacterium]